ncbi:MAG TPA: osmotically inducible protein OsmC [Bacteroidales bacterium]|nr:MAG: osmotically inducible protein OsmC [Bacteroidetes bacterium GWE2_42_24]OFY27450.1 MAG: osmotically inducible protein OsmC [Bacteroidetes bacterium GWF2_43_11]HAQ65087.1 osmotically inducible protein OsmC [Bacteroidales bacterium]HBZ65964.1 osmotically inducible protein OsmC [Bacteroidales bacterium]
MATIKTTYISNLRIEATHIQSGNTIITDAPTDNQGRGEAFSPTDLLAASLGSCMLTIMGIAANVHGFSIDGTRSEITKIMASNPRRVGTIEIHLWFPANNYTAKEKKLIEHAAFTCPVYLSLHPDLEKNIHLHFDQQ